MSERDDVGEGGDGEDEQGMEGEVVRDDPGEDCSAGGSGCSADADDGADGGGGEHVGGGGEEVGGPALMGGGGEREESVAGQGLVGKSVLMCGTKMMGRTQRAQTSMAILRPELTV